MMSNEKPRGMLVQVFGGSVDYKDDGTPAEITYRLMREARPISGTSRGQKYTEACHTAQLRAAGSVKVDLGQKVLNNWKPMLGRDLPQGQLRRMHKNEVKNTESVAFFGTDSDDGKYYAYVPA